jgi:poly-gamma-glutamate synthesis protein (capsule biosynthesis protein)
MQLAAAGAGALAWGCARHPAAAPEAGAAAAPSPRPATGVAPPDTLGKRPAGPQEAAHPDVALIAAAGDTTLGFNLQDQFDERAAAGISRDLLFPLYLSGVKPLLDWADLAIVNLECPFTERGAKLPKNFNFRARRELVQILREGSVDAVTLANNHLMDFGAEGVTDTIETLDRAGILHFGAGADLEQARRPLIVERGGVRLGFLGYYFQDARDMREPREVYASKSGAGVAGCYTDLACMRAMMEQDLERLLPSVDAAIPFFHWGHEGSTEVRDYQIELAHRAVDLGCRAVLGAHPHRFQGVEDYRGAPVLYSLGNFVFGGNKDPEDKLSAIARMRVPKSGAVEVELAPIQITRWPDAAFQPFPYEGDEKTAALVRLAERSLDLPQTIPQLAALTERAKALRAQLQAQSKGAPADSLWARPTPADSSSVGPHR